MDPMKFFATTPKGMEPLLTEELRNLGVPGIKETRSGVHFEGDLVTAYQVCLWSRLANRVFYPLARFNADTPELLYEGVRTIDWSEHLSVDHTLAVDANVGNSKITHSQYAALKVKDAIADHFQDSQGARPSVSVNQPDLQVNCFIQHNEAQIAIDLSGESLHARGYRDTGSAAPLKENLAAAILMRSGWPEIAKQGGSFVDFMCGSGTLPIEAALMACDIAPGLDRSYYGFKKWKQHDPAIWDSLMDEAHVRKSKGMENVPTILGFDHHRKTLNTARHHIRKAGLQSIVEIEYLDVEDFAIDPPATGLVVLNPPYGRRLGQDDDLDKLYAEIGGVLKQHFLNWQACVFTDSLTLGKSIGIRANKIYTLFNGALECKLLKFDVRDDQFLLQGRLPGFLTQEQISENAVMFRNRLIKNRKHLARWSRKEGISCYRVYDADLPEFAVAVDLYQGEKLWVHIQEYEAPATIDPKKARWRLREVITIVRDLFDVPEEQLFLKTRSKQRGDSQYEKLAENYNFHEVAEGSVRLQVNFEDYLDTGLFLDHRPIRSLIESRSKGKSFLNLFAYTGAATVHAAVGGAGSTTTVDMSKTYLAWARRNMQLNNFVGDNHDYVHADCLEWLKDKYINKTWDIIFVDPPTFSNSKRMNSEFDLQRDHAFVIRKAMRLLAPGGHLYFSTNARRFKLDTDSLGEWDIRDISAQSIPPDFKRNQKIHHCWEFRHSSGT
jgi:23S rRNA (guanine2445-N2)-methyltransferase / 23S rRNA (guanine2069-N7)-methyltransferase